MPFRSHVLPLVAVVAAACTDAPPATASVPPAGAAGGARPDTLVASDGGAVALPDREVARLVAEDPLWAEALRIHYDAIVLDGHIDTPSLMLDEGYAFGERHRPEPGRAHVDLPRMVEGGLDAAFFSIYVSREFGEGQAATDRALAEIAAVNAQVGPLGGAEVALSSEDVLRITRSGRKAVLLGLEGGHALQASADVLRQLWASGIRYVTLTHSNTNAWADASTDAPRHDGLSDHGRALVREMNRLGVLVDLSHVSDDTFRDAIETSRAPVILSHSSAKALHGHARNVSDDLLRQLATNGGVIMINFFDVYLTGGRAGLGDLLDHIDHTVRVAGVDHVGLGSDFDGVPSLPVGMEDATRLPWITYGLLKRGYSEADVRKVLGGNALRVMAEAERVAERLQAVE